MYYHTLLHRTFNTECKAQQKRRLYSWHRQPNCVSFRTPVVARDAICTMIPGEINGQSTQTTLFMTQTTWLFYFSTAFVVARVAIIFFSVCPEKKKQSFFISKYVWILPLVVRCIIMYSMSELKNGTKQNVLSKRFNLEVCELNKHHSL